MCAVRLSGRNVGSKVKTGPRPTPASIAHKLYDHGGIIPVSLSFLLCKIEVVAPASGGCYQALSHSACWAHSRRSVNESYCCCSQYSYCCCFPIAWLPQLVSLGGSNGLQGVEMAPAPALPVPVPVSGLGLGLGVRAWRQLCLQSS